MSADGANQTAATPAPATTTTGASHSDPVPAPELLGEITKLKNQYTEESKAKQELEKKLAEQEKLLAVMRERDRKEAEAYAVEQKPKYEKYIEALTASGIVLNEAAKKGYEQSFCDPLYKQAAKDLELQYKAQQEIQASKKKLEEDNKAKDEKIKQLEQNLGKLYFPAQREKKLTTALQQRPLPW